MSNYVQVLNTYRDDFTKGAVEFRKALPPHISPEKFIRVALSAIQNADENELMKADRSSIRKAVLRCAADGLLMNGQEAALVIYKGQAQYLPMVRGILKLARNSGEISKVVAQVVHERDEFDIQFVTDDAPIVHRPALGDRGEMIGVYALAKLKDGTWTDPEWMTCNQVNLIRGRSVAYKNNKGPWLTDYEQMALKTVIKRAAKRWPSSTDLDDALRVDDGEYSAPPVEHVDQETGEVISIAPPAARASRASQVLQARKPAASIAPPIAETELATEEGYQPPLAMPDDDFSLPGEHDK